MKQIKITFLSLILTILIQPCYGQEKKIDNTENDYTLLTYGRSIMGGQNSRNVIAKRWGINFKSVAGCLVSNELIDSVETVNKKVNENIEKKFGKNWTGKFRKEINEEYEKEMQITAILDKVDFIKKKDDQMDLEGNSLNYYMTPIENSTEYNVSIEGWETIDKIDAWVSYYRLTVNYKTKKYKLLDDKIEKRR